MAIKGLFFDLDGTLVDTHQANFKAYQLALAEQGIRLTFEDFKKTIGMQAREFLPMLVPNITDELYSQIAAAKAAHYAKQMHLTVLNLPLIEFIQSMAPHHVVALITTARGDNARNVLNHHDLHRHFRVVVTAEDVTKSKPDPEPYLVGLERTGLKPTEVLAFEDSDAGRMSAEAAGLPVIMVRDFML